MSDRLDSHNTASTYPNGLVGIPTRFTDTLGRVLSRPQRCGGFGCVHGHLWCFGCGVGGLGTSLVVSLIHAFLS